MEIFKTGDEVSLIPSSEDLVFGSTIDVMEEILPLEFQGGGVLLDLRKSTGITTMGVDWISGLLFKLRESGYSPCIVTNMALKNILDFFSLSKIVHIYSSVRNYSQNNINTVEDFEKDLLWQAVDEGEADEK